MSALSSAASEAQLVIAAQRGDAHAFERLVLTHRDAVLRLCLLQSGNREIAEDLAQETFLRVWLRIDRLRQPYAFGAWTRRVAVNLARTRRRTDLRENHRFPLEHGQELDLLPDNGALASAEQHAVREEIGQALALLPEASRELVRLHFQEGLSKAEIAARNGVHPSTVGRQLDRAIVQLRRSLAGSPHRAQRILVLLATLSGVSFSATANASPVGTLPAAVPFHLRMLTFLLEGLGIMGTSAKVITAVTAAALIAGGVYLHTRNEPSAQPLPAVVAEKVSEAHGTGQRPHPLGSESVFALKAGEKLLLEAGPNSYDVREITVARGTDDVSAQIRFGNGTTRVFNGGLNRGDFVMLGATNYLEDGSVEGTATEFPPDMIIYLVWQQQGDTAQFRLLSKVNPAFGTELQALQQKVQSARISADQAMREGELLMRTHQMYPTGDVYRNAGKGFVP